MFLFSNRRWNVWLCLCGYPHSRCSICPEAPGVKKDWLKLGLDVDKGGHLWWGSNLNDGGFAPCLKACGKDKEVGRIVCDSSWGGTDCDWTHKWSSSDNEPVLGCLLAASAVAINVVWWTVSWAAISWRTEESSCIDFSPPSFLVYFSSYCSSFF